MSKNTETITITIEGEPLEYLHGGVEENAEQIRKDSVAAFTKIFAEIDEVLAEFDDNNDIDDSFFENIIFENIDFDERPTLQDNSGSKEIVPESSKAKMSTSSSTDKKENKTNVNSPVNTDSIKKIPDFDTTNIKRLDFKNFAEPDATRVDMSNRLLIRDFVNYIESASAPSLCTNQQTHSEVKTGNTSAPKIKEKEAPKSSPVSDIAISKQKEVKKHDLIAADDSVKIADFNRGPENRVKVAKSMIGTAYKQENNATGLRTGTHAEALEYMDCAEFVCRVLAADKITPTIQSMGSSAVKAFLDDQQKFIFSQTPKIGDIAVWEGHVGIVTGVDKDNKIKLTHARGVGKLAQENAWYITPQEYRPGSKFYGYYRPLDEK